MTTNNCYIIVEQVAFVTNMKTMKQLYPINIILSTTIQLCFTLIQQCNNHVNTTLELRHPKIVHN